MRRRVWLCGAMAALGALWSLRGEAALLDPAFEEAEFVSLRAQVTAIEWAPDGSDRLFILNKGGHVWIVEHGKLLATPFAVVSPIQVTSECGLLGIAFDPSFIDNGFVYLFVTVSSTEQQIIRYRASGNAGEDKTVIVAGLPTRGANHDGGAIGFGPDGALYWAIGDNGARVGTLDDLSSLAAKVGRANRDGTAPTDNPFFDGPGPNNDYIWARGFRNPFTMTFQPATGRLWLNVVGQRWEQVFTPQAGDHGGYHTYESNQPSGYLPPVIAYRTNSIESYEVADDGAARSSAVLTLTTRTPHRLRPGAKITLAGFANPTFDGTLTVASVPSDRALVAHQAGSDAVSGGGTVSSTPIGSAVTGGTFWDSTAVPSTLRGSFLFGDYVSGRIMLATLGPQNQVVSVDEWGNGHAGVVDMAVGPDGDLYLGELHGKVHRVRYVPTSQSIVVSRSNLRLQEGGRAAFGVRLATPLGENETLRKVVVSRWQGDSDVSVVEGATLRFDASNWAIPQTVVAFAAPDADSVEDTAILRVASTGLPVEQVRVRVTENDRSSVTVAPSSLGVDEGSSGTLEISLSQPPVATTTVHISLGGDPSLSLDHDQLTFGPGDWSVPKTVVVAAAQDEDTEDGAGTLEFSGDGLWTRSVPITIQDDDPRPPTIVSVPPSAAVVGVPYAYDVDAVASPTATYALEYGPPAMTINEDTGQITWIPEAPGEVEVEVRATNDVAPDARQAFEIVVAEDQPPSCVLTTPRDGDTLEGTDAEFFGDVSDDVGNTRAEFLVDGDVVYTDENSHGRYYVGGSHHLFDTTRLTNGEHVLELRGYDSAGQSCVAGAVVNVDNPQSTEGGAGASHTADGGESGTGGSGGAPSEEAEGDGDGHDARDGAEAGGALGGESDTGCGCAVPPKPDSRRLLAALSLTALWVGRRRARQ